MPTETDILEDDELDQGDPEPLVEKPAVEDKDDLKSAMAELAGTVKKLAEPKAPEEPELTQEQKDEFWGIYNPEKSNKEFMRKWFRLNPEATAEEIEEVRAMWNDAQKGLVRQAVVGSRRLFEAELAKRDERLQKLEEFYTKAEAKATRSRFNEAYPGFSEKRFDKILKLKAQELASGSYASEDEFFKALAEGAAKDVRELIPDFDLGVRQTTPKTKPAGTPPRLPRTSAGGTGGTGGGRTEALSVKGDATDEFLAED